MSKTTIVAVANQKGGTGKSTTAHAVGTVLADRGRRVLLVDFDPQSSLTDNTGTEIAEGSPTVYDALAQARATGDIADLASYVRALGERLDLLPADIGLGQAEMELQSAVRREYVLQQALDPAADVYDVVLIDCAPSLGLLTINALTAATEVIIPVSPEYPAVRGLRLILDSLQTIRRTRLNPRLAARGVVLTMVDARTNHGCTMVQTVKDGLGAVPLLGEVKRAVAVSEAAERGLSITRYAPQSETAQAYERIANDLLAAWGRDAGAGAHNSPRDRMRMEVADGAH
jgi:chromosome partitioning protein